MKIGPLADVKARLSAYLDQVETEGPIIITRNGKPAAVLLAPTDDEDLERLTARYEQLVTLLATIAGVAQSPRLKAILDKSRQSLKAGNVVPHNEFWVTVARRQKTKRGSSKTK
jgi:prevent-host-death family protein